MITTFFQYLLSGVLLGGVYAAIAVGFVLIYKSSGVFNFAQGELTAIGAFVCWTLLQAGLSSAPAIIATLAIMAALGALLEYLFVHRLIGQPIMSLIVVTIALSVVLRGFIALFWGGPVQAYPAGFLPSGVFRLGAISLAQEQVWAFVICLVIIGVLFLFFDHTKLGLALKCVSEGHLLSQSVGISVGAMFALSWVLASVVSGVGGIFLGQMVGLHVALPSYGLVAIPVVLLGGLESFGGALVGGIIMGIITSLVGGYLDPIIGGGASSIAPYIVMILILLVRPQGLFGWKRIERI